MFSSTGLCNGGDKSILWVEAHVRSLTNLVNPAHNVHFVKYDVTVSFMAQVLDTVTYFVPQVLDTAS